METVVTLTKKQDVISKKNGSNCWSGEDRVKIEFYVRTEDANEIITAITDYEKTREGTIIGQLYLSGCTLA